MRLKVKILIFFLIRIWAVSSENFIYKLLKLFIIKQWLFYSSWRLPWRRSYG